MTHDYRDVLMKAASRVEEEGAWCQWRLQNNAGARCAAGHIFSASNELGVGDDDRYRAISELEHTVGWMVPGWNDTPGRTAHEVAEAMRRAAE